MRIDFIGNIKRFEVETPAFMLGADNEEISNEVMRNQKRHCENPAHTSFEDFIIDISLQPKIKELQETIVAIVKEKDANLQLISIWSHVQAPNESTNTHDHMPNTLSFVYYAKVPLNSGNMVFEIEGGRAVSSVTPVEGMLLFFPGWIRHKVTKNLSNDTRISISGNFHFW